MHFNVIMLLLACTWVLLPIQSGYAAGDGHLVKPFDSTEQTEILISIPEELPAEQVLEFVAPLSDVQMRTLLIRELMEKDRKQLPPLEKATGPETLFSASFEQIQSLSALLALRIAQMSSAIENLPRETESIIRNLTDNEGASEIIKYILILFFILLIGYLCEWVMSRWLKVFQDKINRRHETSTLRKAQFLLLRMALSLTGILIFTLVAYGASFIFFSRFDPPRVFVTAYLLFVSSVRVAIVVLRFVFGPKASGLRLLHINDEQAKYLHHWFLFLISVISFLYLTTALLGILTASEPIHLSLQIYSLFFISILTITFIWFGRKKLSEIYYWDSIQEKSFAARIWHIPTIIYLVIITMIWSINTLLDNTTSANSALLSVLALLMIPIIHSFSATAMITSNTNRDNGESNKDTSDYDNQMPMILCRVSKNVIIVLTILLLLQSLGADIYESVVTGDKLGEDYPGISILITIFLAYAIWELVKGAIAKHLPKEKEQTEITYGGEGGEGAPASRAETLLPLLRKFIFIVIIVMVTMIVLSSLGINIGPLLAGAGVIGLAVGFGAQTLVQDIISGIFFLVDDAFRVGEYIEAADMRGTVEKISVRSLRLRHHLGPVQTIPYSEISTVKNHSRDYIIMKLLFRLPYDVDIEKVRKIIKKVGQKLLEHPEIGPDFLAPLKSQGILEMDDSAMIMRMKFTSKPGKQWVIRREAYRQVKDALHAAGIKFAHRQVTVHVPGAEKGMDEQTKAAAGAAAIAGEQQQQDKPNPDDIR